jgi:hypothetical protein
MRAMGITPYEKKVQEEMFSRLKQEARKQDDFFKRYDKPSARRIFKDKIIQLHEQKLSTQAIADQMNVTTTIILDELRKAGYVRRKSKNENTITSDTSNNTDQPTKLANKIRAKASPKKSQSRD